MDGECGTVGRAVEEATAPGGGKEVISTGLTGEVRTAEPVASGRMTETAEEARGPSVTLGDEALATDAGTTGSAVFKEAERVGSTGGKEGP